MDVSQPPHFPPCCGVYSAYTRPQLMAFDLLIKNGLLIDGTGAPARRADVGISNGKILSVQEKIQEKASLQNSILTPTLSNRGLSVLRGTRKSPAPVGMKSTNSAPKLKTGVFSGLKASNRGVTRTPSST